MTGVLASFGKPFDYQVAAFRLRLGNLVPSRTWDEIAGAEHDRGFMVAGAIRADILADLAAAIDKAISQGTTLEEFRRDFRSIVAAKGWQISLAGQGTKGGEAWRTRVIYRTNMATSYAAGRMAQLVKAGFAFWVYRHGASVEPREQHLAWDGLVLEPDHPFWATHAPPNGWGCSCYIVGARNPGSAKRVGGRPEMKLPDGWQAIDKKTGVQIGIDKGWDHAPGASVAQLVAQMVPKLAALPPKPSVDLIQSWLRLDGFANWMRAPTGLWPVARLPEAAAEAIKAKTTVASLSPETVAKQMRAHPELAALDYLMIQRTVDAATIRVQDSPNSMIFVLEDPEAPGYVLVVKATLSGNGLFVTSFLRLSSDQVKRDETIRRLLKKQTA
ncbi:phage head morphogenesis protein [Cypionkella psychrotolerans]|uniref:phage head morphogenesis protein n=1 Tax=Cypionkella psychrotolerans TaxID=1678131 RepID=UPI0006B407A0|nr:phage minor head protein [Cypionkella psychrotolerans]